MTSSRSDNEAVLIEIAHLGDFMHILRHLEATGAMGEMNAYDVAHEEGLDLEEASPRDIAEAFVEAFSVYVDETMPPGSEAHDHWHRYVAETYGREALSYHRASQDHPDEI